MIPREGEPTRFLDAFGISQNKTSNVALREWSTDRWKNDTSSYVASDIINNGKELLLGSNVDWKLVLDSIRVVREYNSAVQFGKVAIAANGARLIGGLAARAGWSMHDPQSVYLSGKYLAHIAKLEDFKITIAQAAVSYGKKTLPEAELSMKTLDLLLEHRDIRKHTKLVEKTIDFLRKGDIQGAYTIVSSLDDIESSRGPALRRGRPVSSKTTTSSILTPPKPGI